jgi:hypothetical protein
MELAQDRVKVRGFGISGVYPSRDIVYIFPQRPLIYMKAQIHLNVFQQTCMEEGNR